MNELQGKIRYRANLLNAIKVKRAELNDLESSLKVIESELDILQEKKQPYFGDYYGGRK